MMVWGSARHHERAMLAKPSQRRRCPYCPAPKRASHNGTANGVALMSGCEWHVRMWVKGRELRVLA